MLKVSLFLIMVYLRIGGKRERQMPSLIVNDTIRQAFVIIILVFPT